jgi:hypothetical protein
LGAHRRGSSAAPEHRANRGSRHGFEPAGPEGVPVEKKIRNWSELNVTPFDKHTVDPYTRTRETLMTV